MADSVPDSVSSLLRRSFGRLRTEVPANHRRVVDELGALVVALDVDGEALSVRADADGLAVTDGPVTDAGVRVTASRAAILAVLDAEATLAEVVQDGRVDVLGDLDDVLRAHDALMAYAHGAVRAPSSPGLLDRLREGAR